MATYDTPIPGVPQYGQAALLAKTAYGNALARLNQRRSALLRSTGMAGDIDSETGTVTNVHVDGSSRYGALQQLNRSQAMRDESARYQGVERGLGAGGGLAAQLRSQERFDFGREDSDLAQQFLESLSGLQDEQNSAAYERDAALYQAELEAARLAILNEQFNPAAQAQAVIDDQKKAAAVKSLLEAAKGGGASNLKKVVGVGGINLKAL